VSFKNILIVILILAGLDAMHRVYVLEQTCTAGTQ
jgi:hypothetical protein